MTTKQHYLVHVIAIIAIVVLSSIILKPSEPLKDNSAAIDILEAHNANLMKENDALKTRIYYRNVRIDSIEKSIADQKPQIIYINNQVNEIHDSNLTDSVLIILRKNASARDTI